MTTKTKTAPDLLTFEEARKRLRIGKSSMYGAIAKNEVPHIRIGRRILIPRVPFERFLAGDLPAREVKAG